jgi:hypothetical protein
MGGDDNQSGYGTGAADGAFDGKGRGAGKGNADAEGNFSMSINATGKGSSNMEADADASENARMNGTTDVRTENKPVQYQSKPRQARKGATVVVFSCVGCYSWCCHFYLK